MKEVTLTELFNAIVNLTKAIEANTAAKQAVEPKETPAEAETEAALLEVKETPAPVEDAEAEGVDVEPKEEPKETPAPTEEAETEAEGVALRDVEAALLEVKAAKGAATAQKLLKNITGSTSVKKADPAQYQAILDACEAALNDADEPEPEPEPEPADRNKMEELIAELATSELGKGRPENFETAKRLIKNVGKAEKKANIADENIQPMIEALEKAIADLKDDL